ncbi:glycosyltransferase family 2 protein [Campylobacter majalis]|uniref:glycosyltransferase family 2 protein n=1 Tax=Campylobacter majalis TaxID=2790656 RepID=UPI003D682314
MKKYDVSVIVPVYNVEKFIQKCAVSLFEQDHDSIEYIFVNDCTPDNSMQILQDVIDMYPNRKDDVRIINNPENIGSSKTRQVGLKACGGGYLLFMDSDDWTQPNMISSMYQKAKDDDADIVCCDMFLCSNDAQVHKKESFVYLSDADEFVGVLSGAIWATMPNKLIKHKLFETIEFPNFCFAEDVYIMVQLFYYANKISYIPQALYYYNRTNTSSLTTKKSHDTLKDLKQMYLVVCEFLKQKNIYEAYIKYHRVRTVNVALYYFNKDFKKIIKSIDNEITHLVILQNQNLSFFKKVVFLLPFFGFDRLFVFIRDFRRKILRVW